MLQTFSSFILALLLSISIVGPSLLVALESEVDMEVVQDVEEEKKESKKELEEYEKFLNEADPFLIDFTSDSDLSNCYYIVTPYGHIRDIHCPPPDDI